MIGGIIIKKEVLELKANAAIVCYIEILQNNIARMSNLSGIIKASMCVVYTIIITIIMSIEQFNTYWWITIPVITILAILDAYYLAVEKIYIDKYNEFLENLNSNNIDSETIYDMKPRTTSLKCELLARTISSCKSFSIWGFYTVFIVISLIIHFI